MVSSFDRPFKCTRKYETIHSLLTEVNIIANQKLVMFKFNLSTGFTARRLLLFMGHNFKELLLWNQKKYAFEILYLAFCQIYSDGVLGLTLTFIQQGQVCFLELLCEKKLQNNLKTLLYTILKF